MTRLIKENNKVVGAYAYDRKAEEEVRIEAKAVVLSLDAAFGIMN